MAKGYYLVVGDKTTCGGKIIEGDTSHTLLGLAVAREQDRVICGQHPGMYVIVGHIPGDLIHGRYFAGTLNSKSSCPCQARFIPSRTNDTYEFGGGATNKAPQQPEKQLVLPPYVTGEKTDSGYAPDYPAALINTHNLPDARVRAMLEANNQDVMFLTQKESVEVLDSWGWAEVKSGWVSMTQSAPGQLAINYGVNGKDIVTTSMIINQLGQLGIKATIYVNDKGTELIKLTGYPGIRKVLNAPVFAAKNPKVVDLGIGKYGLKNSIISGARLTFYVAAAYRTVDFILNDETSLAEFLGALTTDVVKIGIASLVSWGAGAAAAAAAMFPFVAVPLVVVVGVGLLVAWGLNELDKKFGATDKVVMYMEAAQQEFVEKARELEDGIWDLGEMFVDRMLEKGKEILEAEVRGYLRDTLKQVIPRMG